MDFPCNASPPRVILSMLASARFWPEDFWKEISAKGLAQRKLCGTIAYLIGLLQLDGLLVLR